MNTNENKALAMKVRLLSLMVVKLAKADFDRRLQITRTGITPPAVGVLRLVQHGVRTIHDLSNHMMIAPATLVPMVDLLERKSLLKRGKDSHDRRKNPLSLTPQGLTLVRNVPLIAEDDLLMSSLAKLGRVKSRALASSLEELVILVKGDRILCDKILSMIHMELERTSVPK